MDSIAGMLIGSAWGGSALLFFAAYSEAKKRKQKVREKRFCDLFCGLLFGFLTATVFDKIMFIVVPMVAGWIAGGVNSVGPGPIIFMGVVASFTLVVCWIIFLNKNKKEGEHDPR